MLLLEQLKPSPKGPALDVCYYNLIRVKCRPTHLTSPKTTKNMPEGKGLKTFAQYLPKYYTAVLLTALCAVFSSFAVSRLHPSPQSVLFLRLSSAASQPLPLSSWLPVLTSFFFYALFSFRCPFGVLPLRLRLRSSSSGSV